MSLPAPLDALLRTPAFWYAYHLEFDHEGREDDTPENNAGDADTDDGWDHDRDGPSHWTVTAEVGCDNPAILSGLATPRHPAETCWILETLTDTTPGSILAAWFGPSPLRAAR